MRKLGIKTGDKFGKLRTIKFSHKDKYGKQYWIFKCECGTEKVINASRVKNGGSKSCGCLHITHGLRKTRTYCSWISMKQRCYNPNRKRYKDYGGRGITICKHWMFFKNFLADMGIRPKGKTLDRFPNNNGNYCPENCRWATPKQQNNNRR